jgi:acetylornithine deacetylase/succinyl-diaminopimelate desuccinylase-like protein
MARPVMIPLDSPYMQTAQQALKEAFGKDPVLVREGASVPITELFQRILHVEPLLVGFGLPDDNLHSPNEHFHLEQYYGGIVAIAAALKNLGEIR